MPEPPRPWNDLSQPAAGGGDAPFSGLPAAGAPAAGAAQRPADPAAAAAPRQAAARREAPAVDLAWVKAALAVLAALAVVALLRFAASVFITLFTSFILAFALEPLVAVLCRRARLPRQAASAVVVFLFAAALYGALYFAYLRLTSFLHDLPALVDRIRSAPLFERLAASVREFEDLAGETARRIFPGAPAAGSRPAPPAGGAGGAVGALLQGLGSATTVIFSLSFIPFLAYFILADKEPLSRRTRELFPEERHDAVAAILEDIERMMRKFLLGNAIVAAALAAATCLLFRLVGLPYWLVLGAASGVLSIVPYLGLPLALLPGALVGLVSFSSPGPFAVMAAGVTVFHVVAANLLTPRLVGSGVRLNAVASTMGLLFFGWLWGGMGLLLAIPIVAVLKCVLENIPATRRIGLWLGH